MQLFVMRHGEAVDRAESDSDRSLTDTGRDQVVSMVERCIESLQSVDEIWVSPYKRAQETASLVSGQVGKPVIIQDCLTPTDNPDQVLKLLRETDKTILMISHQPLVGTLVDMLAGLETGRYRIRTAGIACIETEFIAAGCAELRWLHQPQP